MVWPLAGVPYAGALTDPVEAWSRCGPVATRHTVVAGEPVVLDGAPVHPGLDDMLAPTGRSRPASRPPSTDRLSPADLA